MKLFSKFTEADLIELIVLLKGFDIAYPNLCERIDRVEYELSRQIYTFCCEQKNCCCPQSFEEWHQGVQKARAGYDKSKPPEPDFFLAIKSLSISDYLRRAALAFPDLSIHIDRLIYGILSFDGKLPQKESFEEFHRQHDFLRKNFVSSRFN
jgi:hypothetical protein